MERIALRCFCVVLIGCGYGCALVVYPGSQATTEPWGQLAFAEILDKGLDRVGRDLSGKSVELSVTPSNAFFSKYAGIRMQEAVWKAGGNIASGTDWTLSLYARVIGRERTERKIVFFFLYLGRVQSIPIYYGMDEAGEISASLLLTGPFESKRWDLSAVRKGRTAYAFQVFGPYNIDMASSKEEGLLD